jgi:glycerol-3-phosphate dehydrogenase
MDAYDVVVVGAGIHGAGCAQAAAAAGYSVLLLEKTAIACGSSSRSSKLIHGGLRYLESAQFRLVRESLHERAHMLRLAPELVHLKKFFIPIYRHTRRRPWQLRIGLMLYALLAGLDRSARFGTVPRAEWTQLDGLDRRDLQRVFWYHDAQTDDRLLTQAVVRSAQSLGAAFAMPASFTGAVLDDAGVTVRYEQDGARRECRAAVLINAGGPWADRLAHLVVPPIAVPQLQLVRGSHLILPGGLAQGIYYVESPRDGRAIFAMPWHGDTLFGTTESPHHSDPGAVAPTTSEVHYLLGIAKHYFPHWRSLEVAALKGMFAGLRVLPGGPGHAFHRSRETLLVPDRVERPRVLTIYGGKLTTWRAVAARAIAQVAASLPARTRRADTLQLPLGP